MTTSSSGPRWKSFGTLALAAAAVLVILAVILANRDPGKAEEQPLARDWRMVGWAYAEAGDAQAAAEAYRKATRLEPDNAENWSSLGESLQVDSTSVVPEAAAALQKAVELNPDDPRARYFLAVQKDLAGNHRGAVEDWATLLRDTPEGAPWRADLQRTLDQAAKLHKIDLAELPMSRPVSDAQATAAIPGPTREQLAAAASIPAAEQDRMARAMVDRLASRLSREPRDYDGWVRLMRSRLVLKDTSGAAEALQSALKAFANDPATQARLRSVADSLGVSGT
jgi:cytochrome c-type biogenesis protein CcmH